MGPGWRRGLAATGVQEQWGPWGPQESVGVGAGLVSSRKQNGAGLGHSPRVEGPDHLLIRPCGSCRSAARPPSSVSNTDARGSSGHKVFIFQELRVIIRRCDKQSAWKHLRHILPGAGLPCLGNGQGSRLHGTGHGCRALTTPCGHHTAVSPTRLGEPGGHRYVSLASSVPGCVPGSGRTQMLAEGVLIGWVGFILRHPPPPTFWLLKLDACAAPSPADAAGCREDSPALGLSGQGPWTSAPFVNANQPPSPLPPACPDWSGSPGFPRLCTAG